MSTTHIPRHRVDIPTFEECDLRSLAICTHYGRSRITGPCGDWRCPRHNPSGYADSMARHATDSISSIFDGDLV